MAPPDDIVRRRRLVLLCPFLVIFLIGAWTLTGTAQQPEDDAARSSASSVLAIARGLRAFDAEDFAAALAAFEEAKAAAPDQAEPLYYLGITLDKLNRPKEAAASLRQALAIDPHFTRARFALGVVLFAVEQYEPALPEFAAVERAGPAKQPSIWMRAMAIYYQGLIYHKLGAYARSTPKFLKAMDLEPGLGRSAHYYAGAGFFHQGLLDQAWEEFEDAIAANPPDSESRPAKDFLAQIEKARQQAKRWSLHVGLARQYHSNVVTFPEFSLLSSEVSWRDDAAWNLTLRAGLQPFISGRWTGEVSYAGSQSLYQYLTEFNVQRHAVGVRLVYKRRLVAGHLAYDFTYATIDRRDYLAAHTIAPAAIIVWSSVWATQLQYRYHDKDFRDSPRFTTNSARDGDNTMLAITQVASFGNRGSLRLAYAYDRDATRNTDWTYTGHKVTAGANLSLPRALTVSLEAEPYLKRFEYPNSASASGEKRNDDVTTYAVSAGRHLAGPFTITIQYAHTRNISNLALFDYRHSLTMVTLGGDF